MENPKTSQFKTLLNTFYEKFRLYDETNIEIKYKIPKKLIIEIKNCIEDYDNSFKEYLEDNYTIEDKEEIMNFIEKNPTITGFLYEITPLIKEKFPNHTYKLEYVKDPEIENWEQISLNIMAEFDKENIDQLVDTVLEFELYINKKIKEYDLINKFMMDAESLWTSLNG